MLQVNNNSVCAPVFLGASPEQQKQLITELSNNQLSVYFFSEYAKITTGCVRTIEVPQKCLKSFKMLSEWVINKGVKLWNY